MAIVPILLKLIGVDMAELSHEEVVEILGGLGDVIIAEVIATGITKEELEAARARVIRDLNAQTPRDVAANFYLHTRLAEVMSP